jgi:arylsulfatase A-like enzyme
LDGVNLMPHLTGESAEAPHDILFWRMNGPKGDYSARRGDLKLVRFGKAEPALYDLSADVGETKDLAQEKPGEVKALLSAIGEWEKGTLPPTFASPKPKKRK